MGHPEIAAMCRRMVSETLGIPETEISVIPWDHIIYVFAREHDQSTDLNPNQIRLMFQAVMEDWFIEQLGMQEHYSSTLQRHHDYYANLNRLSRLQPSDFANYNLAMERERRRKVVPIK